MRKTALAIATLASIMATAQEKITHVVLMKTTGNDTIPVEKFDSLYFNNSQSTVDMGTGALWAKYNVGANSEDEEGDKYAWGMTETQDSYSWETYMCKLAECGTDKDPLKGVKNIAGTEFDVATKKMGKGWRMPTQADFTKLYTSCTWKEEKRNGHVGMLATSKSTGNTLFFPGTPSADGKSYHGQYYTATYVEGRNDYARRFDFQNGNVYLDKSYYRYYGFSVRGITNDAAGLYMSASGETFYSEIPNFLCLKFITEGADSGFSLNKYLIDAENGKSFEISAKGDDGKAIPVSELDWRIEDEEMFNIEESENSLILTGKAPRNSTTKAIVKYNGMTLVCKISIKRNPDFSFPKETYSIAYRDSLVLVATDELGNEIPASEITLPTCEALTFEARDNEIVVKNISKEDATEKVTFTFMGVKRTVTFNAFNAEPGIKLNIKSASLNCNNSLDLWVHNEKDESIEESEIEWIYDEKVITSQKWDSYRRFTLTGDADTTVTITAKYNDMTDVCRVTAKCLQPALHLSVDTVNIACDSFFSVTVRDEHGIRLSPKEITCSCPNFDMEYKDSTYTFTVSKPTTGKTYVTFQKGYYLVKSVVVNMTCELPYGLTLSKDEINVSSDENFWVWADDQYGNRINQMEELEFSVYPENALNIKPNKGYIDCYPNIKEDATVILTVKYHDAAKQCTINVKGAKYSYVDMGLPSGTMWATTNLKASKPEEYGGYFAWGEIKSSTSFAVNYYLGAGMGPYDLGTDKDPLRDYVPPTNRYGILPAEYDAATQLLGESWRIPTDKDFTELMSNSTMVITTLNGVKGAKITSKINENSIFMPFAGYYHESKRIYEGESAVYQTANCSWESGYYSKYFCISTDPRKTYIIDYLYREEGKTIRPVYAKDPLNLSTGDKKIGCDDSFELYALGMNEDTIPTEKLKITFSKPGVLSYETTADNKFIFKSLVKDNFETIVYVDLGIKKKSFKVEVVCREEPADGKINGYEFVDMGLPSGTKWANRNVGATSRTDIGEYFAFAETKSKDVYLWLTYMDGDFEGAKSCFTEKDWLYEYSDTKALPLGLDAANANMGGSWYVPTVDEWKELIQYCTEKETKVNGVEGILLTSMINGNTLFFPASGQAQGADIFYPSHTFCMTASMKGNDEYYLFARNTSTGKLDFQTTTVRYIGSPVRGVSK